MSADSAPARAPDDRPHEAQAPVTSLRWTHRYGTMLIETFADGSVRIDGNPVRDTLPTSAGMPSKGDAE